MKKMSLMDWAKEYKGEVPPYLKEEVEGLSVERDFDKVTVVAVHGQGEANTGHTPNEERKP